MIYEIFKKEMAMSEKKHKKNKTNYQSMEEKEEKWNYF